MFLVPRLSEYYTAYQVWKNVEDYSLTDNAFIDCCGNNKESTLNDSIWRENYYNFMKNNYDAIIVPVSGGEQQRVAFIRVLLQDLDIILIDEPGANLDEENKEFLLKKYSH